MDVIIYDDEFRAFGDSIAAFGTKMDDIFERYVQCMDKLGNQGIKSGSTSQNIKLFVIGIKSLKGDLSQLTKSVSNACGDYITDVDKADDFLF